MGIEARMDELIKNLGAWGEDEINKHDGRPTIEAAESRGEAGEELADLIMKVRRFEGGCCPQCGKPMETGGESVDERCCAECVQGHTILYFG